VPLVGQQAGGRDRRRRGWSWPARGRGVGAAPGAATGTCVQSSAASALPLAASQPGPTLLAIAGTAPQARLEG
jgi:hypothetical protein